MSEPQNEPVADSIESTEDKQVQFDAYVNELIDRYGHPDPAVEAAVSALFNEAEANSKKTD